MGYRLMLKKDEVLEEVINSGELNDFLDLVNPKEFDEFSRSVLTTLRKAVKSLESNADKFYNQSEEQLSTTIALIIESSGYKTMNEPSVRGHIDIYVEKDGFKWLIEAKIGYNNSKIFEGLLQLCSRYLTDQRSACLLLYFKKRNIKSDFESWKSFLENKSWVEYAEVHDIMEQCNFCLEKTTIRKDKFCNGYSFISGIKTTAGESLDIYNVGANLHYNPFDSSGREGAQLKKEQAKIFLQHFYHARETNSLSELPSLYKALDDFFEIEIVEKKKDEKAKGDTKEKKPRRKPASASAKL